MAIPDANTAAKRPFIGVEPFDATYGADFRADEEDEHPVECRVVEDGGHFRIHRPRDAAPRHGSASWTGCGEQRRT